MLSYPPAEKQLLTVFAGQAQISCHSCKYIREEVASTEILDCKLESAVKSNCRGIKHSKRTYHWMGVGPTGPKFNYKIVILCEV